MKRHMKYQVSAFWFLLGKSLRSRSTSSESGFTLIESLVAIIVISVTVVAISPPIFWAAATRVQNRRAEQALSIAQGAIDEVRGKVERGGVTVLELPEIASPKAGGLRPYPPRGPLPKNEWNLMKGITPACNTVKDIKPAQAAIPATDTTAAVPAVPAEKHYPNIDQYLPVDTDGDCKADFLVQIFRNDGICSDGPCAASTLPPADKKPLIFSVGVRVYSAIAKDSPLPTLEPDKAQLIGTTGTGQTGSRPLAVLYSTVVKSDSSTALNRYRELCKTGSDKTVCE
jgi:prepilin-type N-terminal cleavage/methylation domain-containing protein